MQLHQETIQSFALDGAVVLRGVLNQAQLTQLTRGIAPPFEGLAQRLPDGAVMGTACFLGWCSD